MSLVKLVTKKEHRFGQKMNISGTEVTVGAKGQVEVDEKEVSKFLVFDFELVDKSQKFDSLEQAQAAEDVAQILESAKLQAKEIIESAKLEASQLLESAKLQVSEKEKEENELKESLGKLKVEELKQNLATSNVPEDQYKNLKKDELIDLIIKLAFS